MLKKITAWLAVIAVTIVVFDGLAYFLLPPSMTSAMPGYRQPALGAIGHGTYPHHYFQNQDERGFDIRPGATGQHHVEGRIYDVWANALGCYDDEEVIDGDYIYLAGDSYLWGYVPHAAHFERRLSAATDHPLLKCGVGHSGQRHQLSKYRDVTKKIGHAPRTILLFYAANDVANDQAFPHSTVIDGWLIDQKKLDADFKPFTLEREVLERRLARLEKAEEDHVKIFLKRHSATAQIVEALAKRSFRARATSDRPARRLIYDLARRDVQAKAYPYADAAYAAPNKEALSAFKAQAEADNARLVAILIPPKERLDDPAFYGELKAFLDAEDIEHLDLSTRFQAEAYAAADLYYAADPHFHEDGHQAVAAILIDSFPDLFPKVP